MFGWHGMHCHNPAQPASHCGVPAVLLAITRISQSSSADSTSKLCRMICSGCDVLRCAVLCCAVDTAEYTGVLAEKNLKVLKDLLRQMPEGTRLCFVGDGPSRPELERHFQGCPVIFTVSGRFPFKFEVLKRTACLSCWCHECGSFVQSLVDRVASSFRNLLGTEGVQARGACGLKIKLVCLTG